MHLSRVGSGINAIFLHLPCCGLAFNLIIARAGFLSRKKVIIIAVIHIELRKNIDKDMSVIVAAEFNPASDNKNEICNTVNDIFNNAGFLPQDDETSTR